MQFRGCMSKPAARLDGGAERCSTLLAGEELGLDALALKSTGGAEKHRWWVRRQLDHVQVRLHGHVVLGLDLRVGHCDHWRNVSVPPGCMVPSSPTRPSLGPARRTTSLGDPPRLGPEAFIWVAPLRWARLQPHGLIPAISSGGISGRCPGSGGLIPARGVGRFLHAGGLPGLHHPCGQTLCSTSWFTPKLRLSFPCCSGPIRDAIPRMYEQARRTPRWGG